MQREPPLEALGVGSPQQRDGLVALAEQRGNARPPVRVLAEQIRALQRLEHGGDPLRFRPVPLACRKSVRCPPVAASGAISTPVL
jgi:hypothetical protein